MDEYLQIVFASSLVFECKISLNVLHHLEGL